MMKANLRRSPMVMVGALLFSGLFMAAGQQALAAGVADWERSVSVSRQSKEGGTVLWGSFELSDRRDLGSDFFFEQEVDAFLIWTRDRDRFNPGLGYRIGLGYRLGEAAIYAGGGLASVHNADQVPGLDNSLLHVTVRAGISYRRIGVILDHLSEPAEDDSGITTLGLVVHF